MSACINHNDPEYKKLLRASNLSPEELDVIIQAYWDSGKQGWPSRGYILATSADAGLDLEFGENFEPPTPPPSIPPSGPIAVDPNESDSPELAVEPYYEAVINTVTDLDMLIQSIEAIDYRDRTQEEHKRLQRYKTIRNTLDYKAKKRLAQAKTMKASEMLADLSSDIDEALGIARSINSLLANKNKQHFSRTGITELQMAMRMLERFDYLIHSSADNKNKIFLSQIKFEELYAAHGKELTELYGKAATVKDEFQKASAGIIGLFIAQELQRSEAIKSVNVADYLRTLRDPNSKREAEDKAKTRFNEQDKYVTEKDNIYNYILALDTNDLNDPLIRAIKREFDFEMKKDQAKIIQKNLTKVQERLGSRVRLLTNMGADGFKELISKFSNTFYTRLRLVDELNKRIAILQRTLDNEGVKEVKQQDRDEFAKLVNNRNTLLVSSFDPIDPALVPELYDNEDLKEIMQEARPSTLEERNAYKEKMILHLGQGNRAVGEDIWKELIQTQEAQLLEWFYKKQDTIQYWENSTHRHPQDLIDSQIKRAETEFFRQSPFRFASNLADFRNQVPGTKINSPVRSVLVPRLDDPNLASSFNSAFLQVENDQELYGAYKVLKTATDFINKNRIVRKKKYRQDSDRSLPFSPELTESWMTEFSTTGEIATKNKNVLVKTWNKLKDWIKIQVSDAPQFAEDWESTNIDPNAKANKANPRTRPRLKEKIRTMNEEAVNRISQFRGPYGRVMLVLGVNPDSRVELSDFNMRQVLINEFGQEAAGEMLGKFAEGVHKVSMQDILYSHAIKAVGLEMENVDLVDSLFNAVESASELRKKKLLEPRLTFIMDYLNQATDPTLSDDSNIHKQKEAAEYFIRRKFYNRVKTRDSWLGNIIAGKVLTGEQKIRKSILQNELVELQRTLKKMPVTGVSKEQIKAINDAVKELEEEIENIGRLMTLTSIVRGLLLKFFIFQKLGYNINTQFHNRYQGHLSNQEGEGNFWRAGNIFPATSYSRRIRNLSMSRKGKNLGTPLDKKNANITNQLLMLQGIFQNSYNELEERRKSASEMKKESKIAVKLSPFYIVEEIERRNQTPLILSVLADVTIKSADGKRQVPIFDINLKSGEAHPAFDLDSAGNLTLKPEFDTEENRSTWLDQNSEQHAALFADSGYIPTAIRTLHGDYADNTTILAKSNIVGQVAMMFKTWAPMYIKWKLKLLERLGTIERGKEKDEEEIQKAQDRMRKGANVLTMKNMIGSLSLMDIASTWLPMSSLFSIATAFAFYSTYIKVKDNKKAQDIIRDPKSIGHSMKEAKELYQELIQSARGLGPALYKVFLRSPELFRTTQLGVIKWSTNTIFLNNGLLNVGKYIEAGLGYNAERLATMAGVVSPDKSYGLTEEETIQIGAYNALLVRFSSVIEGLIVKLLLNALLKYFFDFDDDDEYRYNKEIEQRAMRNGILVATPFEIAQRIASDPAVFMYYFINNTSARMIEEGVTETDIHNFFRLITPIDIMGVQKLITGTAFDNMNNIPKTKGPNMGLTGFEVELRKLFPSDLGMESTSRMIYEKSWIDKAVSESTLDKHRKKVAQGKLTLNTVAEKYKMDLPEEQKEQVDAALAKLKREYFRVGSYNSDREPTENSFFDATGKLIQDPERINAYNTVDMFLDDFDSWSTEDIEAWIQAKIDEMQYKEMEKAMKPRKRKRKAGEGERSFKL